MAEHFIVDTLSMITQRSSVRAYLTMICKRPYDTLTLFCYFYNKVLVMYPTFNNRQDIDMLFKTMEQQNILHKGNI